MQVLCLSRLSKYSLFLQYKFGIIAAVVSEAKGAVSNQSIIDFY